MAEDHIVFQLSFLDNIWGTLLRQQNILPRGQDILIHGRASISRILYQSFNVEGLAIIIYLAPHLRAGSSGTLWKLETGS